MSSKSWSQVYLEDQSDSDYVRAGDRINAHGYLLLAEKLDELKQILSSGPCKEEKDGN